MTRYPLYRKLGRPQGRSGRVWKISPTPGFHPRTGYPVAGRYDDPQTSWGYTVITKQKWGRGYFHKIGAIRADAPYVETKKQQDRQCTFNVTLWRVCVTTVAVETQYVLNIMSVCLYSCLGYPACQSHLLYAVYIVLCSLSGFIIFFPFLKKFIEHEIMFWISVQLLSDAFRILRRIQRDIINVRRSSYKVPVILVRF